MSACIAAPTSYNFYEFDQSTLRVVGIRKRDGARGTHVFLETYVNGQAVNPSHCNNHFSRLGILLHFTALNIKLSYEERSVGPAARGIGAAAQEIYL